MTWYQMFEDDDTAYLDALRAARASDLVLDLRSERDLKVHRAQAACVGGAAAASGSWTAVGKVLAHDREGLEEGLRLYAQSYEWELGPLTACPVCKPAWASPPRPKG